MSTSIVDPYMSPVEGYPKLASFMGKYPDYAIYRRFGNLNSQNLLSLQAELTYLERKLRRIEAVDFRSTEGNRSNYSKDWYWLNSSELEGNSEQLDTVRTIRGKLNEYNNTIIQQATISRLADPNIDDLRFLQSWLERPNLGNCALVGRDRNSWGASNEPVGSYMDLFAMSPADKNDPFSTWFTRKFITWFHWMFWHRVKRPDNVDSKISVYKHTTLHRCMSHITTVVASLLPILAIVALYSVKAMKARLGFVALFTFLFDVCLLYFTNATRGDIFIATSTFAAVQVVFISTNNGMD